MKQPADHSLDIFSFSSTPFSKPLKNPYLDDSRQLLLSRFGRFLEYRGFAVLTGTAGSGKTSMLHHFAGTLHPTTNKIMYVPFSILSESDMLRALCHEMELEPAMGKSLMLRRIQTRIQDIQPVNPILILDEVQKITHKTVEVIRLMANFNFDGRNLFSVIMAGTDEFIELLRMRINEPLRQRVTLYVRLEAFTREHTEGYIQHHFQEAGVHHQIITKQAVNLIHDTTSGIPRLINSLALTAAHAAGDSQAKVIDIEHVRSAAELVALPTREVHQ